MDDFGHPLEPLDGTTIVVVVVEVRIGVLLTSEGLVGLLSTRGTMKTLPCQYMMCVVIMGNLLKNDVKATIASPANQLGKIIESALVMF